MSSVGMNISSRIRRTVVSGLVVAGIGLALLGTGAVHAQDNNPTSGGGTPCIHDGTIYSHGDTIEIGGVTYVCSYGSWVPKTDIVLLSGGGKVDGGSGHTTKHLGADSRVGVLNTAQ